MSTLQEQADAAALALAAAQTALQRAQAAEAQAWLITDGTERASALSEARSSIAAAVATIEEAQAAWDAACEALAAEAT